VCIKLSPPPLGSRRFWQEKRKSQKNCQKNGQIFWPHFIREFPLVFFYKTKNEAQKKKSQIFRDSPKTAGA